MITNFEEITEELTQEELALIPFIVNAFKKYTKEEPIKATDIVSKFLKSEHSQKITMTQPRLRKMVNYIRTNALLPLIATSNGYYVSTDKEEIEKQILSLTQRANSILKCAKGLSKLIENNS
jgi:hypothetical protein